MAEIQSDKAQDILDTDAVDSDQDAGVLSTGIDEAGSLDELAGANLEDTAERLSLQEQESSHPENNGIDEAASGENGAVSPSANEPKGVLEHLDEFRGELEDLLRWKERLKLTSIEYQLSNSYYEAWIKEANLFFRRLVILKKRAEMLKKQKRA